MTFRLGGYGIDYNNDPEAYARAHVEFGYNAAYMPNIRLENREEIAALVKAFAAANLVVAEGGAWKNLIAHDEAVRKANLEYAVHQLALGDEIGAGAIVAFHGTAGHPGDPWQLSDNYDYGPHPDNQSEAGFQRAVDTARYVIDMVKPKRTKFSLEMVPWLVTDTPENYLKLLKAIERPQFGTYRCCKHGHHTQIVFQHGQDDPALLHPSRSLGRLMPRQGPGHEGRTGDDFLSPGRSGAW
ncbi:TIM barrel protein [Rhizobium sp. CNPSo 3490]|uniref:TIM barrel protein n=1 Tax=Rhizobium sp. CNPSo 3490 TaxID=3021407 RepID=UPI00254E1155|nr:TIM barrel protein [Rhizobium sp. CNPSo 3490]MDK4731504.1 TIM barrel protein [Rhizobium sp. CNPSo 3490]